MKKEEIKTESTELPTSAPNSSQNCNDCCLETLYTILEAESTEEQGKQLIAHIEKCLPCYEQHNLEIAVKKLLQDHLEKKCPPKDLLEVIRSKILAIG